jgi:hypothetical protein
MCTKRHNRSKDTKNISAYSLNGKKIQQEPQVYTIINNPEAVKEK